MHLGIDIGGTSVKLAAIDNHRILWTASSDRYTRASTDQLIAAIRQAASRIASSPQSIGLCMPGLLDRQRRMITFSVNVPGLVEVPLDELISCALGPTSAPSIFTSDAVATAVGVSFERSLTGRLFCLALGTGIGAAVVDDGIPLKVSGDSPGHFGQLDVSLDDHPPLGPDGGAGSLEAYLGLPALTQRYGQDVVSAMANWQPTEPPLRALARAIRIAHAIYRPDHIVLAGGIGIRLAPLLPVIKTLVSTHLSSIARPDWTLSCGDSDFHAATGAALLASRA